jgi:uncharacterized membrane protein YfcA
MPISLFITYLVIGVVAGVLSGIFGIGGGILIVPALVYTAGFSQLSAIGTSLAVLLPPIGIAAALEYYNRGYVNIPAAIIIAVTLMTTAWLSARFTVKLNPVAVKIGFGVFLIILGGFILVQTAITKR